MLILGIETSCDETAAAVLEDGKKILSNIVTSQIPYHAVFGGIVPEIASRKHVEFIAFVVDTALKKANISLKDIDLIAVTVGPGLIGSLIVGMTFAKAISVSLNIKIVGVNHIEGHIKAIFLEKDIDFPFVALVVSGGHTELYIVYDHTNLKFFGKTRDDAAGEAFDKVARILDFGYPGGPIIDKLTQNLPKPKLSFPIAHIPNSYDFSFSGIKTAVLRYVKKHKKEIYNLNKKIEIANAFQWAVVEVLVEKTLSLAKNENIRNIVVTGGVAANSLLRRVFLEKAKESGKNVYFPKKELCTDNAAMIAIAGYYRFLNGEKLDLEEDANPNLTLKET